MIPPCDPRANVLAHREEIEAAFRRVLESGRYVLGAEVRAFEAEFAGYVGCAFGIGVASGTDAIELALRGCGVERGDCVFTVPHTAVATVVGIERAGAVPILVDIDPDSFTMDPLSLERAIQALRSSGGGRPRAVVPVHLYGHPANLPAILEIARSHDLRIVEDCAQAHGATLGGKRLGSFGHVAAFSFYPTKNLAALGDAGFVATSDPEIAERVRGLREYGWRHRNVSEFPGMNSRLDEVQAAILRVRLGRLDAENERRRSLAALYNEALASASIRRPTTAPGCTHVFHQYVIRTARRDELRERLESRGIGTAIHYPIPVHLQPAYRGRLSQLVSLSAAERAAAEVVSLPMYPELPPEAVTRVAAEVIAWSASSLNGSTGATTADRSSASTGGVAPPLQRLPEGAEGS